MERTQKRFVTPYFVITKHTALGLLSLHCVGLQATTLASFPPPTYRDLYLRWMVATMLVVCAASIIND